jgi:serine/threonine protein kinase
VSAELREGQTFGGYHIVELVGSGGMGLVYRAEQRILGRTVALKVIRPEIAESGDYRSRFLREARLAAAVDHPHVVSVFDVGENDGRLYLTMQWVDGLELGTLIDRHQRLAPERTVLIGVQLAGALQAVHDAGLVHRDVKPSNVLVRDIGGHDHAYLTDFGIAKAPGAQDNLTRTGLVMGTPGYLSPEQIRGQRPGPGSDLYALGCIIFEALTGQRPFRDENDLAMHWAHASGPRPVASTLCPALGLRYDAFLARALAVDPGERFSSGRAFAEALQAAHTGRPGGLTDSPAARDAPTQRPLRPSPPTPAASGTRPATAATSSDALDPTLPRQAGPRQGGSAARAAGAAPAGAARVAPPAEVRRGARPLPAGSRARASRVSPFGQLVILTGALVFIASVTLVTEYTNKDAAGWTSLWRATHGDPVSPLSQTNFWISLALVAAVLAFTAISAGTHKRLVMIGALAASLGLIGYTLYLPAVGSAGFRSYGSSYWLSLAAAIAMMIGAGAALTAPGRRRSPPAR